MTDFDFSPTGFPAIFTTMIAEATMELPPLTQEGDSEFLQAMQVLVTQTFWTEYFAGLSAEANAERETIVASQDVDAFIQWFADYADFEGNPECRGLAQAIIEEMKIELPALMKEKYDAVHSTTVA